jgi:protein phosphatase
MLRIAEQWHDSDLGRQRQGNEDNYFVRAPAVRGRRRHGRRAGGRGRVRDGGRSFDGGLPDGDARRGLVRDHRGRQPRIHERSRAERQRAGMGTTSPPPTWRATTVTVAHVGDSRCYLLRDGDLDRLTRDHSLVGELVARGKLTEEQAERTRSAR